MSAYIKTKTLFLFIYVVLFLHLFTRNKENSALPEPISTWQSNDHFFILAFKSDPLWAAFFHSFLLLHSLSHHFSLDVLQPLWWHVNDGSLLSKTSHCWEMMAKNVKPHLGTKRGSWLESYWALRADLAFGLLLLCVFIIHYRDLLIRMYNLFHLLNPQPRVQHFKWAHTKLMLISPGNPN